MIRLGEILCGMLIVLLIAPVLMLGFVVALFDIRHYLRNVFM